jgi:hypothetical protein
VVTQGEDSFPHCGSALARAVPPQYGQLLQNNREKSDSCGRMIRFFSAVELAVSSLRSTLSTYNSVVKIHRVPSSGLGYGVPISQA